MTGTLLLQNFTPSQNDLILWEPLKYLDGAICKHSNPWFSFCNTVPTVQTSCCQYPNNTMTDLFGMPSMQGHHCIHTKWKSLSALGGNNATSGSSTVVVIVVQWTNGMGKHTAAWQLLYMPTMNRGGLVSIHEPEQIYCLLSHETVGVQECHPPLPWRSKPSIFNNLNFHFHE